MWFFTGWFKEAMLTLRVLRESPIHIPWFADQPVIRILLPFVSGILLHAPLPTFPSSPIIIILVASLAFILQFQWWPLHKRFRWEMLRGITWTLSWVCLGWLIHTSYNDQTRSNWYGHQLEAATQFGVEVKDVIPTRSGKSMRIVFDVNACYINAQSKPCSGEILGWWPLHLDEALPKIGDIMWIKNNLQPIQSSTNPGAFDWKTYAARQQWHHQLYLAPGTFIRSGHTTSFRLAELTYQTQTTIRYQLSRYLEPATLGLGEALLLGYRHDVDAATLQAYSDTGVVHLIAVSGMHLGLVYIVLLYLFSWIPTRYRQPKIESVAIVMGIWIFALLTGAGASVLRAAVMLSFLQLGRLLKRPAHACNQLWLSAWILLIWNPNLLWDVGFQLSYAAVGGILWIYPWMRRPMLDWPTHWRYIGELLAVSIAAQVFTTPLSLMHFHQFPNYFLLANLLTVSLASAILIALIILTGTSLIPGIAAAWGKLVSVGLALMQQLVGWISEWPGAVTKPIASDGVFALLFSIGMGLLLVMLQEKRWRLMYASGIIGLMLFVYYQHLVQQQRLDQVLIVYDTKRSTCIDIIQREHAWTWHSDSSSLRANRQTVEAAHTQFLITQPRERLLPTGYQSWKLGNTRIARVDVTLSLSQWQSMEPPDILLIGGKANQHFITCCHRFRNTYIILEPTVPLWKQKQWTEEAQQLTLRCWPVSLRGALMLPL